MMKCLATSVYSGMSSKVGDWAPLRAPNLKAPGFAGGYLLSLSPLDRAGVARMVGGISAQHALSKDVIEGVSERTGGVPLFVEEVTRLLLERGEQGGVQAIPPTLSLIHI